MRHSKFRNTAEVLRKSMTRRAKAGALDVKFLMGRPLRSQWDLGWKKGVNERCLTGEPLEALLELTAQIAMSRRNTNSDILRGFNLKSRVPGYILRMLELCKLRQEKTALKQVTLDRLITGVGPC